MHLGLMLVLGKRNIRNGVNDREKQKEKKQALVNNGNEMGSSVLGGGC